MVKYQGQNAIFHIFTCLKMGVAGTWTGPGPRDLGQQINEMLSYALCLSNMVSEHRNGAIMQKKAIFIILPV